MSPNCSSTQPAQVETTLTRSCHIDTCCASDEADTGVNQNEKIRKNLGGKTSRITPIKMQSQCCCGGAAHMAPTLMLWFPAPVLNPMSV